MMLHTRRDDELAACVALLAGVHAANGYPLRWPADPLAWLSPAPLLGAWVAEQEHALIGHVALSSAAGDAGAHLRSMAAGLPPELLAVITRLFVAPDAQGRGTGAALLAAASAEARDRGLRPALEVLSRDREAIALYERMGWRRVASAAAPWADADGGQLQRYYYLAPVLQIRRATRDDIATIAELLRAAFAEYTPLYTPDGLAATTPSADQIAQRFDEGPVWLAVAKGTIVSTIVSTIVGTVAAVSRGDALYVRSMAALPAARGRNVGRLLFAEVERYARAEGFARLLLSTTPFLARAIRLYESLGFQRSDDGPHDLFGTPLFTMTKMLNPLYSA